VKTYYQKGGCIASVKSFYFEIVCHMELLDYNFER
jgi:hypothetical protein